MSERPTPETDAEHAQFAMGGFTLDFCRKLERERDEAREDAAHWKTEYEIVVDRLRGRKHPRDNGIIADDEIIPKLERERDEALEAVRLASIEAKALATSIQKSEYSDVKFELCDSVAGVISQIDNMYAGVREQRDEARGERDALRDAVNALHDYVHGKRNDDKDISEILNGAMKI